MSNPKMADAFGASAEDFKFFEKLGARSAGGKSVPLSPDNAKRGVQLGADAVKCSVDISGQRAHARDCRDAIRDTRSSYSMRS